LVDQVAHYKDPQRRDALAREMVRGAEHSLLRNVAYYTHRRGDAGPEEPAGEIAPAERAAAAVPVDPEAEAAVDAGLSAPSLEEDRDPLDGAVEFAETAEPLQELEATLKGL